MCLAQDLAGPNCHGFQLNITWPEPKALERYKTRAHFNNKTIVLQCGNKALEVCRNDPIELVMRLQEYEGLIDYVLIDPSGGHGQEFNVPVAMDYFAKLDRLPWLGFGIAGGLHAGNLDRLSSLVAEYSDFSIDAEGRLRDSQDDLNIEAARAYLQAADNLLPHH
jgi:phosphoribosylanthranilate isomerase